MLVPRSFVNVSYNEIGEMGCLNFGPASKHNPRIPKTSKSTNTKLHLRLLWCSVRLPQDAAVSQDIAAENAQLLYWVLLSTSHRCIWIAIETGWWCQGYLNIDKLASHGEASSRHSPDRMEHVKWTVLQPQKLTDTEPEVWNFRIIIEYLQKKKRQIFCSPVSPTLTLPFSKVGRLDSHGIAVNEPTP